MNQCTAILRFNLRKPDEAEEFHEMLKWHDYKRVLSDLMEWIREQRKYHDVEMIEMEVLRDKLVELMQGHRVEL